MENHLPIDSEGRDLKIGDWVRVIAAPLSIRGMPPESLKAFSRAIGLTFQIKRFDESGCLELHMWSKISFDTIWLEPFCVRRFRRYKRLSKAFNHEMELAAVPTPPRFACKFDARIKEGVDLESFGFELIHLGTGGGFAVYPKERRIQGSVFVNQSAPNALELLQKMREITSQSDEIESIEISEKLQEEEM